MLLLSLMIIVYFIVVIIALAMYFHHVRHHNNKEHHAVVAKVVRYGLLSVSFVVGFVVLLLLTLGQGFQHKGKAFYGSMMAGTPFAKGYDKYDRQKKCCKALKRCYAKPAK